MRRVGKSFYIVVAGLWWVSIGLLAAVALKPVTPDPKLSGETQQPGFPLPHHTKINVTSQAEQQRHHTALPRAENLFGGMAVMAAQPRVAETLRLSGFARKHLARGPQYRYREAIGGRRNDFQVLQAKKY